MKRQAAYTMFLVLVAGTVSVAARAETKEVEMTAKKYEFSPSSVEVPVGTTVVFKITALDRDHGFEIEGVKDSCVQLKKGEVATVEYKAEKAGTFSFKCCKRCGLHHSQMKGTIVVK
jgi:cytochrome c oxidase subunit II